MGVAEVICHAAQFFLVAPMIHGAVLRLAVENCALSRDRIELFVPPAGLELPLGSVERG